MTPAKTFPQELDTFLHSLFFSQRIPYVSEMRVQNGTLFYVPINRRNTMARRCLGTGFQVSYEVVAGCQRPGGQKPG